MASECTANHQQQMPGTGTYERSTGSTFCCEQHLREWFLCNHLTYSPMLRYLHDHESPITDRIWREKAASRSGLNDANKSNETRDAEMAFRGNRDLQKTLDQMLKRKTSQT
jgi:hypothetical protein